MFKKFFLTLSVCLIAQSSFAIDKKDVNIDYFNRFNDECLFYYVNQAFDNNHDLKKAAAVVEQYRQQAKYSLGRELPSFSVSANYLGIKVPQLDNFELRKNAFILPFVANYEADFLLKNRDKTRSIKKAYEASQYEEKAIYISLLSDVATVYANILQYDELIKTAQQNVELYASILQSDSKKFSRGIINSTQINNSRKNLETAKNLLEQYQKEQSILLMQLAILTGISSQEAANLKRGSFENFEYQDVIPSDFKSDIIFSRPDVMSAEKKLEKAKIDIRVARKEFLPTFNITGIWAFNTIAPGAFFSWESSLAAILAGAAQDIFAGGRKIANLRFQKAKYEELFEEYKQTDLEAVKEVNTALCLIKHDTEIENNTKQALTHEYSNFLSSQKRLNQGTISNSEHLISLAAYLRVKEDTISAKNQRLVNYFTLYKTVGGKL